jgi:hypothetical protein
MIERTANIMKEGLLKGQLVFDTTIELMKGFKYTTDVLIEHRLYENTEKFQTYTGAQANKHPFSVILTRLCKIISVFTDSEVKPLPEVICEHADALLSYNSFENLDILIYFTKPIGDESCAKLRELCLKILRSLYHSGQCKQLKDRLEKIRFTEVVAWGAQGGAAKGSFEFNKDKMMKS